MNNETLKNSSLLGVELTYRSA